MADPQPQNTATEELIRGILRSVDPTVPANADEFGKVALAALEQVNKEAGEVAEAHLPQVSSTLAEHVSNMATVSQAVIAYRDNVVGMTSAAERFNAARIGHTTVQGVSRMCEDQRIKARNIQLEVDRQIALLISARAAVAEFITTGAGIIAAQTGTDAPAPETYAGRLAERISALQNAFTQAAVIQKTLNDRKKTLASGLDLLSDISVGMAAVDVDFLKLMSPKKPTPFEQDAEHASEPEQTPASESIVTAVESPGESADTPSPRPDGVPDATQLAGIILAAQAKRSDPPTSTSTALMVIPQPR
jgi:hypothetical protein